MSCSSKTTNRGGGGGGGDIYIYFLKARLFKSNSEINLSRSWLWSFLKYLLPKLTTSQHMRPNQHSVKMNVLFYLKAEKAENYSSKFSDL